MAKIALQDATMSQKVAKEFKRLIADINDEHLLKEGCKITDLIDQSN